MNSLLEYKGYHAQVEYDDDDKIFVGDVIGIHDFLAFHGRTMEELEVNFQNGIDDYLDLCVEIGKEPDKEFIEENIDERIICNVEKSAAAV